MAQSRAAAARFLKKDPTFALFQKEWDELVERDPAALLSAEHRTVLVALMERHRPLLERAYIGADVDAREVFKVVRSILLPVLEKMLPLDFGSFLIIPPLAGPLATPTEFELTPPFASSDSHFSSSVVGTATALVFNDRTVSADVSSTLEGDGYATAVVGDAISVPAGFTRLKITAFAHSLSYDLYALGLANVSGAGSRIVLELTDSNGAVQRETDLLARVLAPLLGLAHKAGSGDFQITRTLTIPGEGGEALVRAGVQALAWTGGLLGTCQADVIATIDRISVEAQP
ncbi:MAG TPA: hypothetical protein VGJ64_07140 [Gemmatimonadaceae bacterium]